MRFDDTNPMKENAEFEEVRFVCLTHRRNTNSFKLSILWKYIKIHDY